MASTSSGIPFSGVQLSTTVLQAQRVIDMDKQLHELEPDATPLLVLSNALGNKRTLKNPQFKWQERANAPHVMHTSIAYAAGDTALVMDATDYSAQMPSVYSTVRNMVTGEIMLVTAIVRSTRTLTVSRGFAKAGAPGATAAAINPTDSLLIIGSAHPENGDVKESVQTQPVQYENYTQIFRNSLSLSRTLGSSELYNVANLEVDEKGQKFKEHKLEIERSIIHGEPNENTTVSSDGPVRTMGGIGYFITTNHDDLTAQQGVMTFADWERWMETIFRFGGNERMAVCSPRVITAVDQMAYAKALKLDVAEKFGIKVRRIQTSHGEVYLVKHNLLAETPETQGSMLLLDMQKLWMCPYTGADTKLLLNRQDPGRDGLVHEYITETSMQLVNESTCMEVSGIASGAA